MVTFRGNVINRNSRESLKRYHVGVDVGVAKKNIKQIEQELGLDKIRPLDLSPDDQNEIDNKGDVFSSWYQEELREFYESEDKQ